MGSVTAKKGRPTPKQVKQPKHGEGQWLFDLVAKMPTAPHGKGANSNRRAGQTGMPRQRRAGYRVSRWSRPSSATSAARVRNAAAAEDRRRREAEEKLQRYEAMIAEQERLMR